MSTLGALTAELETALVRALANEHRSINHAHFGKALKPPQIAIVSARSFLARWCPNTRALEVSRELVLEHPWGSVEDVLKHEMVHQYVSEVLGETEETPHGPAFQDTCRRFKFGEEVARASGVPQTSAPPTERSAMMEKIAKLLALAGSPEQHEAETAAAQAQRLMLKHNLDVQKDAAARGYSWRRIERTGRVNEWENLLSWILSDHFFVEIIWALVYRPLEGKHEQVLEICGTPENLDIAEHVYHYLGGTAERLWEAHKRENGIGNRERRQYLAGVMSGFAEKMRRETEGHAKEGLVWVKDADLDHFYRARWPRIRTSGGGGGQRGSTFNEGKRAGQGIVLHRAVKAAAENRGLLLGDGGSR